MLLKNRRPRPQLPRRQPPSDVIPPTYVIMSANDAIIKSNDVMKPLEMCESSTGYEPCLQTRCFVCSVTEDDWVEK